jgi:hypothetical protein
LASPYTPTHLSASSIEKWVTCPWAWKRQYIDKIYGGPMGPWVHFGSSMHKAFEGYHRGLDPMDEFRKDWKRKKAFMQGEGVHGVDGSWIESAVDLIALWEKNPCTVGSPEEKFFLKQVNGLEVPLMGYFDVLYPRSVTDYKTSGWKSGDEAVLRKFCFIQGPIYAAAFRHMRGFLPDSVDVVALSRSPVSVRRISWEPSADDADQAIETAKEMLRGIKAQAWGERCMEKKTRYPELCGMKAESLVAA